MQEISDKEKKEEKKKKEKKGIIEKLKHFKNRILDNLAKLHLAKTSSERLAEMKEKKRKELDKKRREAIKQKMMEREHLIEEYEKKKEYREMGLQDIKEGIEKFFYYVKYKAKSSKNAKDRKKAQKELEERYNALQRAIEFDLKNHLKTKSNLVEKRKIHAKFLSIVKSLGFKDVEQIAVKEAGAGSEKGDAEQNLPEKGSKEWLKLKKKVDKQALKVLRKLTDEIEELIENREIEQASLVFESAVRMWKDMSPKYKRKLEKRLKEVYQQLVQERSKNIKESKSFKGGNTGN